MARRGSEQRKASQPEEEEEEEELAIPAGSPGQVRFSVAGSREQSEGQKQGSVAGDRQDSASGGEGGEVVRVGWAPGPPGPGPLSEGDVT